jgi:hypothetical protein
MLLLFALVVPACAQEFVPGQVVFPITDFKPDIVHLSPISMKFGTGFCLDPECLFVGTNYHVAQLMGEHVRIKGVLSAHRYLDSDPDDAGAQDVKLIDGGSLKFNEHHDLAIYEMRHPLKGFHGIGFDADDLENSPDVDIFAFPLNRNPKRGLVHWHGRFTGKTDKGLLAFSYEEGQVRGGASGGIVVDSKTQKIVGILMGVGLEKEKDHIALAVPVKELSNFIARAEPYLQASLFPKTVFVSPVAADQYPPYNSPRAEGLLQRSVEAPEVVKLRHAAQHLSDSMRDFTAVETFAWGSENREPDTTDAYETLIAGGGQVWRRPEETKLNAQVPLPSLSNFVVTSDEWSELPLMVGTELNLRIHQAPDAVVGGRTVHVFQFAARAEDKVCPFTFIEKVFSYKHATMKFYNCHGEAWTDESGNILRISQDLDLTGPFYRWREVMTYGWVEKDGNRYLVPVTIAAQAVNGKTYWCRGLFTDYQMSGEKVRLALLSEPAQAQYPAE